MSRTKHLPRTFWGIQLANGEWLSRGRFDKTWSGAFRIKHPELFDSFDEAYDLAISKLSEEDGEVTLFPFEISRITPPAGISTKNPLPNFDDRK